MSIFLLIVVLLTNYVDTLKGPLTAIDEDMEKLEENCGYFDMKQSSGQIDTPPWLARITVKFKKIEAQKGTENQEKVGYVTKDDDGNRDAPRPVNWVATCGGAILDEYNVITSSNCFDGREGKELVSVDVDFGGRPFIFNNETEMKSKDRHFKQESHGIELGNVVHEDKNDVALIYLPIRLDLAQSPDDDQMVRHVCLPDPHDLKKKYIDTKECFVTSQDQLYKDMQLKIPIMDDNTCQQKLKTLDLTYDANVDICAIKDLKTRKKTKSNCDWNSGGQLYCRKIVGPNTKWVLMGVVSKINCNENEEMVIKLIRMSKFIIWVRDTKKNSIEVKKEMNERNRAINRKFNQDIKYRGVVD